MTQHRNMPGAEGRGDGGGDMDGCFECRNVSQRPRGVQMAPIFLRSSFGLELFNVENDVPVPPRHGWGKGTR